MANIGMTLAGMTGEYIGSRVRVTVPDGQYEGFLYTIDLNGQRITLEKITSCKTGKQINGVQNFFNYEITNLQVITDNRKKADKKRDDCDGPLLVGRKQTNPHLQNLKPLDRERQLLKNTDVNKNKEGHEVDDGPRITKVKTLQEAQRKSSPDTLNHQRWPEHYLVIGQNNHLLKEALIHIQEQTVIGISLEGVKLGRHGQISFLQVGTRSYVFIFDLLALGRTLFDEGLKTILEHPKVQKVIHDCRWVSDALFHQYGIRLRSVFDTQVASVICYRNEHNGEMPRYVQGLSPILIRYLDMPSNHAYFYSQRDQVESDQKVWLSRPAPDRILRAAMRRVMYLLALRAALLEAMLIDFTDGIDIYLGVIRDAPEDKLASVEHHLPYQFRNMNTEAKRMRNAFEQRYQNTHELENMRGPHGFRENCIGSLDTSIIYSHDSVWHQGNGKHLQSLSRTQRLEECHRKGTFFLEQEHMQKDVAIAKDIAEYQKFTAKAKAKAAGDELLLSVSRKEPKTKTQTAKSKTSDQDELIIQVPHTTYVPPGFQASNVDFRSRDIRVTKPDVLRAQQEASDLDDAIPSHQSLARASPDLHKPTSRAGSKPVWGQDATNNGANGDQTKTAPTGVSGAEGRQAVPRGRGLGCQVMNGHGPAGDGRASSDDMAMKGVQPKRPTPPKVALGRSKLLMQILAESGKVGGTAR